MLKFPALLILDEESAPFACIAYGETYELAVSEAERQVVNLRCQSVIVLNAPFVGNTYPLEG